MTSKLKNFIPILLLILVVTNVACDSTSNRGDNGQSGPIQRNLFVREVRGLPEITAEATTETYEVYFHIPISFEEQVPVLVEVECPQLIDYRFIHMAPPNVMLVTRLRRAPHTYLTWRSWVIVKEDNCLRPAQSESIPIPSLDRLPDWTEKWLQSTSCIQVDAPIVREIAASLRSNSSDLIELTENIVSRCNDIESRFLRYPWSLDAVYALQWGSSCTGKAHAAAALFRANGVPARSLLEIDAGLGRALYSHWVVDYYIPGCGWIKMGPSRGWPFLSAGSVVVIMASNPHNEFPLFFRGTEGYWHTSDPSLGLGNPYLDGVHAALKTAIVVTSDEKIEQAHSLTQSVFHYYTNYWGIHLSPDQQAHLDTAFNFQSKALANIIDSDIDNYIANIQEALNYYERVNPEPIQNLLFDDFENGNYGWTHGGAGDEWELGIPTHGATQAYSGVKCWGTDLDDTYENNSDCWLLSPPIDLENLACAYLSFWVFNWVHDEGVRIVHDPLWLDITTDGTTFYPLCSQMTGVNDEPEIPDTGGWTEMVLDLTKYVDHKVRIRFRLQSDEFITRPGSFIDDVRVYGRSAPGNI